MKEASSPGCSSLVLACDSAVIRRNGKPMSRDCVTHVVACVHVSQFSDMALNNRNNRLIVKRLTYNLNSRLYIITMSAC